MSRSHYQGESTRGQRLLIDMRPHRRSTFVQRSACSRSDSVRESGGHFDAAILFIKDSAVAVPHASSTHAHRPPRALSASGKPTHDAAPDPTHLMEVHMPHAMIAASLPASLECGSCDRHPNRACPSCTARRRHAVRLVEEQGLPVSEAAERLGLSVGRVERLLEEEADRRAVSALRQDRVPNAQLRERLADRQRLEPSLTISEIARRLDTHADPGAALASDSSPTAAKTDRRGRRYAGRVLSTISVETAGRIARAMGYAPCEIDGC